MDTFTHARFGAIAILLLCCLAWVAFPRAAETRTAPTSVQSPDSPGRVDGVLISLHGGGWIGDREPGLIRQKMRPFAKPALTMGWAVVHVAYSTGAAPALADIHDVYLRVKRNYGRSVPVCLLGNSAGGHLALTYAGISAKRTDVRPADCVIASAPPTDIPEFRRQAAAKSPARRERLERFLEIGFTGPRQMAKLSPSRFAPIYQSPTLLFTVEGDRVVGSNQVRSFAAKLKRHRPNLFSRDIVLRGGEVPFVHRNTSHAGWETYREQVRRILRNT